MKPGFLLYKRTILDTPGEDSGSLVWKKLWVLAKGAGRKNRPFLSSIFNFRDYAVLGYLWKGDSITNYRNFRQETKKNQLLKKWKKNHSDLSQIFSYHPPKDKEIPFLPLQSTVEYIFHQLKGEFTNKTLNWISDVGGRSGRCFSSTHYISNIDMPQCHRVIH